MPRTLTLRISDEQAALLELMSRVDGVSLSEAIRTAIDERIESRRADEQFQARLRSIMERDRMVQDHLSVDDETEPPRQGRGLVAVERPRAPLVRANSKARGASHRGPQ